MCCISNRPEPESRISNLSSQKFVDHVSGSAVCFHPWFERGQRGKPPLKLVTIGDSLSSANGCRNYEGPKTCYRCTGWSGRLGHQKVTPFNSTSYCCCRGSSSSSLLMTATRGTMDKAQVPIMRLRISICRDSCNPHDRLSKTRQIPAILLQSLRSRLASSFEDVLSKKATSWRMSLANKSRRTPRTILLA
jgi:hypothetical protein